MPGALAWAKRAGGAPTHIEGIDAYEEGVGGLAALRDGSAIVTGFFREEAVFGAGEVNETVLTAAGYNDVFLARYNPDGTLAWAKSAGGHGLDTGLAVAAFPDGGVVVTGKLYETAVFGPGEANEIRLKVQWHYGSMFLARYNPDGTLAWVRSERKSRTSGKGVATLPDGSAFVVGNFFGTATFGSGEENETNVTSAGEIEIFLARYDGDGTLVWARRAGGPDADVVHGVATLDDGSAFLTGWFRGTATFGHGEPNETKLVSEGSSDLFVARYSPDGTLAWARRAGGTELCDGLGVAALPEGSAFVAGTFAGSITLGRGEAHETVLDSLGDSDILVARYYGDGTLAWARQTGGPGYDSGHGIAVGPNRTALVTGHFKHTVAFGGGGPEEAILTSAGSLDVLVACYSSDGTLLWAQRAGDKWQDEGHRIAAACDGSVFVAGFFERSALFGCGEANETNLSSRGQRAIFLAKFRP